MGSHRIDACTRSAERRRACRGLVVGLFVPVLRSHAEAVAGEPGNDLWAA
jgi:hypothetical protein